MEPRQFLKQSYFAYILLISYTLSFYSKHNVLLKVVLFWETIFDSYVSHIFDAGKHIWSIAKTKIKAKLKS